MIQVTHLKGLPRTIDYWDYYILCRCVKHAGSVLQRMEYWDGTKAGGNIHAEQINDQLKEAGKQPTQDTSRFVYKSRDELAWEMLDVCGERVTYDLLDYLSNTLHLLNTRRNPYKAFDRTLQYEFQSLLVQDRLNQLNAIIKHFIALGRQMRPVLFAIEQLTLEGYYIHRVEKDGVLDGKGDLTIEEVTKKLRALHELVEKDNEGCKQPIIKGEKRYKPVLPYFIRADMGRDEQLGFSKESDIPLCKSAQSSVQENTMDCADVHDALCKSAQAIPVITNSNNNSNNDTVRESTDTAHVSDDNAPTPSLANSPSSLQESTEESTPAPSDEQSSKQGSGISDSQSKDMPPAQETGKTSSGKRTTSTRKRSSKKNDVDLDAVVPVAPPTEPSRDMDWSARKAMMWCDHFRGYAYPESNHSNSKYCRARDAVILSVQRGITEEQYVYMFRFMKGLLPNGLKSDYWSEHEVDAWTVNDHWEDQVKEIKRKSGSLRQATQAVAAFAEAGVKPGMRMENGKLVIDSNKTVSGLSYFNIPQRGA